MNKDILSLILPEGLLHNFEIVNVTELINKSNNQIEIIIDLEEKNQLPLGFELNEYESKGFTRSKLIKDFPIRGKAVYFSIRRRRWRLKADKNKIIHNDYSFVAEGSKLTQELSDFLKDTGRNPY